MYQESMQLKRTKINEEPLSKKEIAELRKLAGKFNELYMAPENRKALKAWYKASLKPVSLKD